jgi:hypothetical protein
MTGDRYWHREESSFPFPAQRVVIPASVRAMLVSFLRVHHCPAAEGNRRSHERKHLLHVLMADTGEPLCVAEEVVLDIERGDPARIIREVEQIPDGRWHAIPLTGVRGGH